MVDKYANRRIKRQQDLYGTPDFDPVKLFEERDQNKESPARARPGEPRRVTLRANETHRRSLAVDSTPHLRLTCHTLK